MDLAQHAYYGPLPLGVRESAGQAIRDAATASPLRFDLVSTEAGFRDLEQDWTTLFNRAARPEQLFQSYGWCRHWADAYLNERGGAGTLAILTGYDGNRLVMIWPLVLNRVAGLRELAWLGEPVSQYGDIIAEPRPDLTRQLEAAWLELVRKLRPSVVRLNKTRVDSLVAPLMASLGARITQNQEAPFVDMTDASDWETVEKRHFTAKSIKNRRRQLRRLEGLGPVSFETHGAGPHAAALAVEAIKLKRAWLAEKGLLSPALSDERTLRFFASLGADAAAGSFVRFSVLKVAGETAAISLGFANKRRLAVHIIVYASRFEKAGAGAVLTERVVKAAYEDGFETFDLLAPGGGYKHEWTGRAAGVADYGLALTTAGMLYIDAYLAQIRPRLKVIATRFGSLRRSLRGSTSLPSLG